MIPVSLVDVLRTKGSHKTFDLFESYSSDRNTGIISVIKVAELSAGAALSSLKEVQKKTDDLLAYVRIVELNESVAIAGGKIYADLSKTMCC